MINFNNFVFFYDPFPHCILNDFLEKTFYEEICREFPDLTYFEEVNNKKGENKFSKYRFANNSKQIKSFNKFVSSTYSIKKFLEYLNSDKFIISLNSFLLENQIDLRLRSKVKHDVKNIIKSLFSHSSNIDFEFSAIPIENGYIMPHTDGPNKLVGFVIPIIDINDSYSAKNLGTKILRAKTNEYKFNYYNKTVPLADTELVRELPFEKNQMSLHVKTFNSLHGVGPIVNLDQNKKFFRRSISIFVLK